MSGVDTGLTPLLADIAGVSLRAAAALPAHPGIQSALDPRGAVSADIAAIGWLLGIGAALILAAVLGLIAYALLVPPARRRWMSRTSFIIGAGVVFPGVVLTALLVYTLVAARSMQLSGPAALKVEIVGEQWWWRVRYLDADGAVLAVSANELHIPVGRPVELALESADVIHSFWVPSLAGKLDMIPGRVNRLRLIAEREGISRGQCAEYCGGPHARMALYLVARPPDEFDRWLANERAPAATPPDAPSHVGRSLFVERGCAVCHAVRGTDANGTRGPDLTHVAGRLSIGAGTLPANAGAFAGWIAGSQHLKPGNLMPEFGSLSGEELRALAAYLESLR
jgi:cytochrome c oxidase subunit 2